MTDAETLLAAISAERYTLRAEVERLRKRLSDVIDLCNAADEATLRPDDPAFTPAEIPWFVLVRMAALGPDGGEPQ